MKKKLFAFLFIVNISIVFGQKQPSNFMFVPSLSSVNFSTSTFMLNWGNYNLNSFDPLSIYNPITNLNDNYYLVGDTYYLSNTKSFSFFGAEGQRIDSFNPSGTNDFRSALIRGAINSLLGKL